MLVIIGASFTVFSLESQKITQPSNCYAPTQAQMTAIHAAIDHFVRVNNRYPTPAERNLGVVSSQYGKETSGAAIDSIPNGTSPILFGALPFASLGMSSSYAVDCWDNQFTYIVTAALTSNSSVTGFPNSAVAGSIIVKSNASTVLTTTGAYAVISHGETGALPGNGAVSRNYTGSSHNWCTDSATLDHNNCNLGAVVISAPFNNGANAGTNFFDDVVFFDSKQSSSCNMPNTALSWTVSGVTCNGNFTGPMSHTGTQLVTATDVNRVGAATFACNNGALVAAATPAPSCAASLPVNGNCGTSHGKSFQLIPTINLCASGTASLVSDTATLFQWSCAGTGGGASANCNATPICACGGITLICTNPRNPFGGLNLLGIHIIC